MSIQNSIVPMSELRADLPKIKAQLRKSPLIITNKGKPDFGVCDLETLAIAVQVKELRDLLKKRLSRRRDAEPAGRVFRALDDKYGG